jgi:hypothetical protein
MLPKGSRRVSWYFLGNMLFKGSRRLSWYFLGNMVCKGSRRLSWYFLGHRLKSYLFGSFFSLFSNFEV